MDGVETEFDFGFTECGDPEGVDRAGIGCVGAGDVFGPVGSPVLVEVIVAVQESEIPAIGTGLTGTSGGVSDLNSPLGPGGLLVYDFDNGHPTRNSLAFAAAHDASGAPVAANSSIAGLTLCLTRRR